MRDEETPTQCDRVVVAMMHGVQSWCRDGVQLVSRQNIQN